MLSSVAEKISSGFLKKNEKVAEEIINSMVDNELKAGDRLPSERNLSKLFNVAPTTIRRALAQLEKQGLIKRRYKRGTFVTGKHLTRESEQKSEVNSIAQHANIDFVPSIFSVSNETLTFYTEELAIPQCRKHWECIADQYTIKSGIKVNLLDSGNLPSAKVIRTFQPDIMLVKEVAITQYVEDNSIQEIEDEQLENMIVDKKYFPTSSLQTWQNGKLYGIPFYINTPVRITNKNSCRLFGLPEELPAKTPGLSQCIRATAGSELAVAVTYIHMILYQLLVDGLLTIKLDEKKILLSKQDVLYVINFNCEMFQRTLALFGAKNDHSELGTFKMWNSFYNGELLCIDTYSYALGYKPDDIAFELGVQPLAEVAGSAVPSRTCLLALSASCTNRQQASDFIRFACGLEGQNILADIGPHIPALQDAAFGQYLDHVPGSMEPILRRLTRADNELFSSLGLFSDSGLEDKLLTAARACYRGRIKAEDFLDIINSEVGRQYDVEFKD